MKAQLFIKNAQGTYKFQWDNVPLPVQSFAESKSGFRRSDFVQAIEAWKGHCTRVAGTESIGAHKIAKKTGDIRNTESAEYSNANSTPGQWVAWCDKVEQKSNQAEKLGCTLTVTKFEESPQGTWFAGFFGVKPAKSNGKANGKVKPAKSTPATPVAPVAPVPA